MTSGRRRPGAANVTSQLIKRRTGAGEQEGAGKADGARETLDRKGRRWVPGNQRRVHQLSAAYSMLKIERIYGTVFESMLGEKVSTEPVVAINSRGERRTDMCLHCESKSAAEHRPKK